jgi:hypothetical protein
MNDIIADKLIRCTICNNAKSKNDFARLSKIKLTGRCKKCVSKYYKQYLEIENHKDMKKEYGKEWYKKNKEYIKQYQADNKEHISRRNIQYRETHKNEMRAREYKDTTRFSRTKSSAKKEN